MHWEAFQFVSACKHYIDIDFNGIEVLEVGSHNVNGGIRELFVPGRYVGLDLSEGPGVDIVMSGHEYHDDKKFDLTISCECFEHNPYYLETFINMVNLTDENGLVIFTCASMGRPEHGTTRTNPKDSPGTSAVQWDYYRNLTEDDFINNIDLNSLGIKYYKFFYNSSSKDLYFIGIKSNNIVSKFKDNEIKFFEYVSYIEKDSKENKSKFLLNYQIPIHPEYLFDKYHENVDDVISSNVVQTSAQEFYECSSIYYIKYLLLRKNKDVSDVTSGKFIYKALIHSEGTERYDFYLNAYSDYLSQIKKFSSAIYYLKKIQNFDTNIPILYKISECYFKNNDYMESIKICDFALSLEPDNFAVLNVKCQALKTIKSQDLYVNLKKLFSIKNIPSWVKDGFK